jgi:hypothetical protein
MIDRAEEGHLSSIRELVGRFDGRPAQSIDRHDVLITELSDSELYVIAAGGPVGNELDMKVLPAMPSRG